MVSQSVTEWLTDGLQELLELLFATKNVLCVLGRNCLYKLNREQFLGEFLFLQLSSLTIWYTTSWLCAALIRHICQSWQRKLGDDRKKCIMWNGTQGSPPRLERWLLSFDIANHFGLRVRVYNDIFSSSPEVISTYAATLLSRESLSYHHGLQHPKCQWYQDYTSRPVSRNVLT